MKEMEIKRMSKVTSSSDFSSWPLLAQAAKQTNAPYTSTDKTQDSIEIDAPLPSLNTFDTENTESPVNPVRFGNILSKPNSIAEEVSSELDVPSGNTPLKPLLQRIAAHSRKLASR